MRLRPILVGILLVMSGGALALTVEHLIARRHAPNARAAPALLHTSLIAELDSTLQLRAAQRDSVEAIFARHQALVDSAWRSINERIHATMDSVHQELVRVLEPGQVAELHDWMRRQHGAYPIKH